MLKEILKYVAGFIVGAGIVLVIGGGNSPSFAGYTTFSGINTTDGYQVDGVSVIDGNGDISVTGETSVSGFTQGGGVLTITATSTEAGRTLTQAQMLANNIIDIAAVNGVAFTLTLPATSTMTTLLPNAGDFREWFVDNQNAAATTTTIVAGAGIDLIAVTANDDVIDGLETARLSCYRKANTNVMCITSELLKAD